MQPHQAEAISLSSVNLKTESDRPEPRKTQPTLALSDEEFNRIQWLGDGGSVLPTD